MLKHDGVPNRPAAEGSTNSGKQTARASVYSSPSIIARRNRILDETRRMIGEQGIAGIGMDEVARRAKVAKRTLYNAYQSKEHLIASAIRKYFEDYASQIDYSTEDATLEWMIERLVIVARRNLAIRNYTRAVMNIYYSSGVDPEIRQAIHEIASKSHELWVRELERKRQLQPWIDSGQLIDMLVRYRYATAHSWAEGHLSDDKFVIELVSGFLTFMAGATLGAARKQIIAALNSMDEHPLLKVHLEQAAAETAI